MAINYPQWISFAKYSYKQLKWGLIEKSYLRDAYVNGVINEELMKIQKDIDATFEDYSKKNTM